MNDIASWINTALLIIIFCYQWNRNRTLSDRIDHQTRLLEDTKTVVTQQATALESQAKVVETAVRYSEAFDPKKLEVALRKQVEAESSEKIAEINKQYQKGFSEQEEKHKEERVAVINIAVKAATETALSNIKPLLDLTIGLMVRVPSSERDAIINELPDGPIKNKMKGASEKINAAYQNAKIGPGLQT